jgi:hypothetical protein
MTKKKKRILAVKIALALREEYGRQPTGQEVKRYSRAARVLYKAVLGVHFERQSQKKRGQIALF